MVHIKPPALILALALMATTVQGAASSVVLPRPPHREWPARPIAVRPDAAVDELHAVPAIGATPATVTVVAANHGAHAARFEITVAAAAQRSHAPLAITDPSREVRVAAGRGRKLTFELPAQIARGYRLTACARMRGDTDARNDCLSTTAPVSRTRSVEVPVPTPVPSAIVETVGCAVRELTGAELLPCPSPTPSPTPTPPPVDRSQSTTVYDGSRWIYEGENPPQRGVAHGTIRAGDVGVLRGRVTARTGEPLAGVTVTALGHPELGMEDTAAGGALDFAVNAGGPITLRFTAPGFLPAQRLVATTPLDYTSLDDVMLVPPDTVVTNIDSSSPVQSHQGSQVTDSGGTRRATLMFAQGTQATMRLPDGSSQPLSSLHVRSTEFTVGPNGLASMPGMLPPQSAYTYAAEYSVDEAVAAGADRVEFDKPVIAYTENFLRFPTGMTVPYGTYDRRRGMWVAEPSGRVVEVLSEAGGIAELDVDGSGRPASSATLASMGITDDERREVARLYDVSATLWRVPASHFSPIDFNAATRLPPGAKPPRNPEPKPPKPPGDPCDRNGSVIGCRDQTLGEDLPLTGTAFGLHYRSDRVPGRVDDMRIPIVLIGSEVPRPLKRIDLTVTVAGAVTRRSFPAQPDQTFMFEWDGRDGYGRTVTGSQNAVVRIGYAYDTVRAPAQSFGDFTSSDEFVGDPGNEIVVVQQYSVVVGKLLAQAAGLGGWSATIHHAYDPVAHLLLTGYGRQRSMPPLQTGMHLVAGEGAAGYSGDNGPARLARFNYPEDVVAAPDGSFFIADTYNNRVRKVGADGIVRAFAGTGAAGSDGDGGPATAARITTPRSMALGPDGSLYVTDTTYPTPSVRRIAPDGTISSVPASNIFGARRIAFGTDGSLYLAAQDYYAPGYIFRIGPDATRAQRIAGGGSLGSQACVSARATDLSLGDFAAYLAIGPDGSLFFSTQNCVYRLDPDGNARPAAYAGNNMNNYGGDGGPASAATGRPADLAVAANGDVYVVDRSFGSVVRRVTADGIIARVAGSLGAILPLEDGQPATSASLSDVGGLALGPHNELYVVQSAVKSWGGHAVRRADEVLPRFDGSQLFVASEDGREVYSFTASGRHEVTLDALTGAVRYAFGYDDDGWLSTITDADGSTTTIERDGAGAPAAIVAPGGQRTTMEIGAEGYLARVTAPGGSAFTMASTAGGLLTGFTDPLGKVHTYTYDDLGRLVRDEDPSGAQTLARTEDGSSITVTHTSALGRTTAYRTELLPTGEIRSTLTDPSGGVTTSSLQVDGTQSITAADGTSMTIVQRPDPRWGMMVPFASPATIRTPDGKTATATATRTAVLGDPGDLLSLQTLTETRTLQGRVYTSTYDGTTRTVTTVTPEGRRYVVTMDALGRTLRAERGGLDPLVLTYNDKGGLASAVEGTARTDYTYDAALHLASVARAGAGTTTYTHDADGRVLSSRSPGGATVGYSYDAAGNRTGITMPSGSSHGLGYHFTGRHASYTPPGNAAYTWTFGADRTLSTFGLPSGRTVSTVTDSGGRLSQLTEDTSTTSFAYTGSAAQPSSVTWTPSAGPSETLSLTYDGSLIMSTAFSGAAAGTFTRLYDDELQLSFITLSSGSDSQTFQINHDGDGLATSFGPFSLARQGPSGAVSRTASSGGTVDLGYDGRGYVSSRKLSYGESLRYQSQITRDAAGKITRRVETTPAGSRTTDYAHDADGRLTGVDVDGAASERYAYDANGNRTMRNVGAGDEAASYDAQDRLVTRGSTGYGFNADGFLASRGADTFDYGARGDLLRANVASGAVTYAYDGFGRRVARTDASGTEQYLYGNSPFEVTASRDPSGVLTMYLYDRRGLLFGMSRAGQTYHVVTDEVGSPVEVMDRSGAVVKAVTYDAFGNVRSDSNPAFRLPIGFAGGLQDPATGLVRFGLRDYEPASGRWTARDPIFFAGGQLDLYAYAGNDPVSLRDPSGLACIGGSAYDGIGGGGTVCVTPDGFSICAEIGFGFGESFEFNPFEDLSRRGAKLKGEVKLKYGPASTEGGCTIGPCAKVDCKVGAKVGPLGLEASSDKPGDVDIGKSLKDPQDWMKSLKNLGAGAEANISAQVCERWP
jgi:RHS repeat-associated protein